eukprot:357586-Chlamydomonas_euryale.AAC.9
MQGACGEADVGYAACNVPVRVVVWSARRNRIWDGLACLHGGRPAADLHGARAKRHQSHEHSAHLVDMSRCTCRGPPVWLRFGWHACGGLGP